MAPGELGMPEGPQGAWTLPHRPGRRYTKMGFGGNTEPSFLIPTAVAAADEGAGDAGSARPGGKEGISDMEYLVGDDAVATKMFQTNYPIRHGLIENWNNMERLWQRCFYEYMRVEPDEHYVLLVSGCSFGLSALQTVRACALHREARSRPPRRRARRRSPH